MLSRILLTSFDTWKPEQPSNSSDDLLALLLEQRAISPNFCLVRRLVVDTSIATDVIFTQIDRCKPDVVLCCGMSSKREQLTVERTAHSDDRCQTLHTRLDLNALTQGLSLTTIGDDAGEFVCNATYFNLLAHLQAHNSPIDGLFLHVPVLHDGNVATITQACATILQRLRKP